MSLGGAVRMAQRVFQFFVGSPPRQLVAGGVAAVVITGIVIGVGAAGPDDNQPAAAAPAAEVQPAPADQAPTLAAPAPFAADPPHGTAEATAPLPPADPAVLPAAGGQAPPPETTATATPRAAAATSPAAPKAAVVTYDAIAGLGCTGKGTSYSNHGWFKNGDAGWWTLAYGSTREGGCDGRFDDMPMSGKAHEDTAGQAILYGFQVGAGKHQCALSLYVPTSSSSRDVAGVGVHLAVLTGTKVDSPLYSSPAPDHYVSQRDHHSSWIAVGTYPVSNGAIGVKFTNRGYSAGYPMTDPHIAGGAMRARCTSS